MKRVAARSSLCAVLGCGPGVGSTSDAQTASGEATDAVGEPASEGGTSGGEGFADACDRGRGWLADDLLRAECSAWLGRFCAERSATGCEASFVTSDGRQLLCVAAAVVVAADGGCAPPEPRCLPGLEAELYLCNSCGAADKSLQTIDVGPAGLEIAILDGERCGVSIFIEGATQCQADDAACACGCGL